MKKYVPRDLPAQFPSFGSDTFKSFTSGSFRSLVYYFIVVIICALSHSVSKFGEHLVNEIRAFAKEMDLKEEEKRNLAVSSVSTTCLVEVVEFDKDEVHKLSTYILRAMYLNYRTLIADEEKEFMAIPLNEDDENDDSLSDIASDDESIHEVGDHIVDDDANDDDDEFENEKKEGDKKKKQSARLVRNWWLYPLFESYCKKHSVHTRHSFWLHVKKNSILFIYELINFFNSHMLDIMRLLNIGLMTVACGTDNINSLINILLLIPLITKLTSNKYTSAICSFLTLLLFVEYGLYIVPNKQLIGEWLGMDGLSLQVKNYLMVANVSSVYMIPNTLTLFCLVLQKDLSKNEKVKSADSTPVPAPTAGEGEEQEKKSKEIEMVDVEGMDVDSKQPAEDSARLSISLDADEKTLMKAICRWIIYQLHNITLIVIFLVSVNNPSLLSSVYLVFSLYYLFNPEPIKQLDSKEVQFIKSYAFIHLALMVVYQLPLFPEPSECQLRGTCIPLMRLIGLNKMVYSSYIGNPTCSIHSEIADIGKTECPGPYFVNGGILSIVIINIIVNILVSVVVYISAFAHSFHCTCSYIAYGSTFPVVCHCQGTIRIF